MVPRLLLVLFFVAVGGVLLSVVGRSSAQAPSGTPIHRLSETELDAFLRSGAASQVDPVVRFAQAARLTIGQPHEASVLGEGVGNPTDPRPLYALDRSSAASFVDQTLALAVADNFEDWKLVLQRLRYRDGHIATQDRNHNLLADWVKNNQWLFSDVTENLGQGLAWVPIHQVVRRKAYLKNMFGLDTDVADEKFIGTCIPRICLAKALPEILAGDVVMLITTDRRDQFCDKLCIAVESADSSGHTRIVMSDTPEVAEHELRSLIWRHKEIVGVKVLRLRANAADLARSECRALQALPHE